MIQLKAKSSLEDAHPDFAALGPAIGLQNSRSSLNQSDVARFFPHFSQFTWFCVMCIGPLWCLFRCVKVGFGFRTLTVSIEMRSIYSR